MEVRKIYTYLSLFLLSITNGFAVQVVQETTNSEAPNSTLKTIVVLIVTFGIIFILIALFILGFVWILIKIWKKITEYNRKNKDFIFDMYETDYRQCHINRDTNMKYRNWKLLWVFWKRKPVYINTSKGLRVIGFYDGESDKKESYYSVAIFNKLGFFKMFSQVLLIPEELKHIIKRMDVEKNRVLVIDCEGVDQIGEMDYYLMPLIKDPKQDGRFLDFADKVYEEFIEKRIHRDIIKTNLVQYRDGIIKSVESNPSLQFNRRKE